MRLGTFVLHALTQSGHQNRWDVMEFLLTACCWHSCGHECWPTVLHRAHKLNTIQPFIPEDLSERSLSLACLQVEPLPKLQLLSSKPLSLHWHCLLLTATKISFWNFISIPSLQNHLKNPRQQTSHLTPPSLKHPQCYNSPHVKHWPLQRFPNPYPTSINSPNIQSTVQFTLNLGFFCDELVVLPLHSSSNLEFDLLCRLCGVCAFPCHWFPTMCQKCAVWKLKGHCWKI